MSKNDGGPAFPVPEPGMGRADWFSGASLRDVFAWQTLPAIISTCSGDARDLGETTEEMFARKAYAIADAMLAERAKERT